MKSNPSVAIIGGGPGGLTAAVILHKAGWNVRVFESDALGRARGQGGTLDLHEDSGQVALQRAGLLEEFRSIARHDDQETRSVDWQTGNLLPAGPWEDSGADRPEIDRGVLRNLLLCALPERIVDWNHSLSLVERNEDGSFTLHFRDGQSREAYVVIGADGAWSAVRQYLTPARPIYNGVNRAVLSRGWRHNSAPSTPRRRYNQVRLGRRHGATVSTSSSATPPVSSANSPRVYARQEPPRPRRLRRWRAFFSSLSCR